ncbi:MAG TPA: 2-dehydropantoate 2-reductase [Solirubrobacteraceae bacterium]|nr:2-dehydropantoate 2-reductase [Solirubrobacteraceae bacterium]
MRFAVVGAGAIGAYLGARLLEGGSDVVLIARGEHLAAIRRNGLRVLSDRGDVAVAVEASDDLAAIAGADVVIVALKAYSIPAVAPAIGELLTPGAATIWAQNGIPWWYFRDHGGELDGLALDSVDPGGVIAAAIPPGSAIGTVVYCSAEIVEPGVVRHVEGTRFTLGEPGGSRSERCEAISEAFRTGGLRAPVVENVRTEIWLKLFGNATFNPVSALTGATLRQFGDLAEMRALMLDAFGEIATVARALGAEPAVSLERRLEGAIEVGDHKTSMLQDLEVGKPLEYQCMTGAIIEIARRLDIEVPRVEAIHACVALLDHCASVAAGG